MAITKTQRNLVNLLRYTEELLKIGERIIVDLAKDSILTIHEHDALGLEGVISNSDSGSWARFPRLRETSAPAVDLMFDGWIEKARLSNPSDKPHLADTHLLRTSAEAASDLIEAGLANMKDVMAPPDSAGSDQVDILLRLTSMPEFSAAFTAYVDGPWSRWAETEAPRRKTILTYNKLYAILQRMIALGEDAPLECVFGVGVARWNHPELRINVPLIEAGVELTLDPNDSAISISPRPHPPQLCLRAFENLGIDALGGLERDGREQLARMYNDADVGFSPFSKSSFEPILRMCSARLSASSVYEPDVRGDSDDRSPPIASEKLHITDTWVIYVRQRSVHFRCADIRRLIDSIEEAPDDASLPPAAVQITNPIADAGLDGDGFDSDSGFILPLGPVVTKPPQEPFSHGSEGSARRIGSAPVEQPIFLPLAFNKEQERIIRQLEASATHGVVVQGPPGTGKTHTIANIICHYMATGRRVLVTARTPEALTAIREKLPQEIRDLVIAVIHSDRQGMQQLEQAIEMLSSQVKQIDLRAYSQACADKEGRLNDVRKEIAAVDQSIRECAILNLSGITYRGETCLPMELASKLDGERERYAWLPDALTLEVAYQPQFSDADIVEARIIRSDLRP